MRTGCHHLISPSVCLSVCVTFVVFTDCESGTRPICTNSGSMEASEYGLTRGTCFVACRLELDAVAGLLWISCCVLGGADFSVFCFRFVSFFERTLPAAYMRPPCLIYLSTSTGVRTGCHYLICLSVCVCVCATLDSSFLLIARAVRGRFPQTRGLWKWASMGQRVGRVSSCTVSRLSLIHI